MSTQNSPASFHDIIAFSFFNLSIAISFFFLQQLPFVDDFFCLLNQREMFSEIQKRSLEGETISLYYNKQFFFWWWKWILSKFVDLNAVLRHVSERQRLIPL